MIVESEMETLIHTSRIMTRQCPDNGFYFSPFFIYFNFVLALPLMLRQLFPVVSIFFFIPILHSAFIQLASYPSAAVQPASSDST